MNNNIKFLKNLLWSLLVVMIYILILYLVFKFITYPVFTIISHLIQDCILIVIFLTIMYKVIMFFIDWIKSNNNEGSTDMKKIAVCIFDNPSEHLTKNKNYEVLRTYISENGEQYLIYNDLGHKKYYKAALFCIKDNND